MGTKDPYSGNTPGYRRRKMTIVYFYAMSGLNCVLSYVVSLYAQTEANTHLLLMGFLLVGLIPVLWIDDRKDNNGGAAVAGSVFLHLFVTVMCTFSTDFRLLLIAYLLEIGVYFAGRKWYPC